MSTFSPIINQPSLYINGLKHYYTSGTTLTVGAGQARDSTNTIDMNIGNYLGVNSGASANTATVLNAAVNGVNGLDTGSLANNTWYYLYIIGDASNFNQPALLLSKSSTTPLLPGVSINPQINPSGFSSFRLFGATLTGGSATFIKFYQVGHFNQRTYQWDGNISVLTTGHATTPGTALDLSTAVPVLLDTTGGTGPLVTLSATYTPNTAGNLFNILPTGGTNVSVTGSGVVTTAAQVFPSFSTFTGVGSSKPEITYFLSNASDSLSLSVTGFTIFV